jgi:hypothetical protein
MNRGGNLKRTELVRRTPLRAKAKLTAKSGMVRRKPPSAKRVKEPGPSKRVVDLVFARDGGCCVRCGRAVDPARRGEDWSCQHRRARGAGGDVRPETNLPANLVILCGSATSAGGCHEWAERARAEARLAGLSMRWKQDPTRVPLITWWGPVLLDDQGRWVRVEQREGCVCDPVLCVNGFGHCEQLECAVCDGALWTEVPS